MTENLPDTNVRNIEYIRREDALDAFGLSEKTRKYGGDHSGYDTRMLYEIQDTIESIEPVDVAPVVHGRWIPYRCDMYECSVCQRIHTSFDSEECDAYYCPHCGAKMDGKGEECMELFEERLERYDS